uniref:Uncharacterized protein n=1 Tax=Anguilla anguilla TaxID=7936 RepID=A0A0E9WN10_ANGAN
MGSWPGGIMFHLVRSCVWFIWGLFHGVQSTCTARVVVVLFSVLHV